MRETQKSETLRFRHNTLSKSAEHLGALISRTIRLGFGGILHYTITIIMNPKWHKLIIQTPTLRRKPESLKAKGLACSWGPKRERGTRFPTPVQPPHSAKSTQHTRHPHPKILDLNQHEYNSPINPQSLDPKILKTQSCAGTRSSSGILRSHLLLRATRSQKRLGVLQTAMGRVEESSSLNRKPYRTFETLNPKKNLNP